MDAQYADPKPPVSQQTGSAEEHAHAYGNACTRSYRTVERSGTGVGAHAGRQGWHACVPTPYPTRGHPTLPHSMCPRAIEVRRRCPGGQRLRPGPRRDPPPKLGSGASTRARDNDGWPRHPLDPCRRPRELTADEESGGGCARGGSDAVRRVPTGLHPDASLHSVAQTHRHAAAQHDTTLDHTENTPTFTPAL